MDFCDPVELCKSLIACNSVTPEDGGALDLLADGLAQRGFKVQKLRFEEEGHAPVLNLFATLTGFGPHLAFNGHIDVVPPGPLNSWASDPFTPIIRNGRLYGRGACDMKSGVAAFIAAICRLKKEHDVLPGSLSLLITGDEEGPAINGSKKLFAWAKDKGYSFDGMLVGEPTCLEKLGDVIKVGRRGSLTCHLTVRGRQGHVAYPEKCINAAHGIVQILAKLSTATLDDGNEYFQPSSLQITTVDIGNPASNVSPGLAKATFNIRYNTEHQRTGLENWITSMVGQSECESELVFNESAEPFLSEPGELVQVLCASIKEKTGIEPALTTGGGTSDARFAVHYAPVAEFGILGNSMHQIDENADIEQIRTLSMIYEDFIKRFWNTTT